MKFDIKRPCAECPFRRDSNRYLRRAAEIRDQMRDDHYWFACHQTTGHRKTKDYSHCAGLMKVLWREGQPNIAMRLALAFKLITTEQLEEKRPAVFRNLDQFARHHLMSKAGGWRKK